MTARTAVPRPYLRYGLAALALAGLIAAARILPVAAWIESFRLWVAQFGLGGMALYALVYAIATVLLFPGSVLTLAAGATFGLLPGFLTVLAGATLGAALSFLVSRHGARARVETWIRERPRFAAVDRAVGREGWKIVLLTRLSPVFPFNFQNYAYGVTGVRFWAYLGATWIGIVPGAFLYTYLGTLGRAGLEAAAGGEVRAERLELALQIVGLIATVVVTFWITRTARRALRESGL